MEQRNIIALGTVAGRHNLPVSEYVLQSVEDPTNVFAIRAAVNNRLQNLIPTKITDFGSPLNGFTDELHEEGDNVDVHLYVTGLTLVTTEIVRWCAMRGVSLTLFHFDRDRGTYFQEPLW